MRGCDEPFHPVTIYVSTKTFHVEAQGEERPTFEAIDFNLPQAGREPHNLQIKYIFYSTTRLSFPPKVSLASQL